MIFFLHHKQNYEWIIYYLEYDEHFITNDLGQNSKSIYVSRRLNRKIIGDWFLKTIQMEDKSVNEFKCDNAFIPQTVVLHKIFWTCKKDTKSH